MQHRSEYIKQLATLNKVETRTNEFRIWNGYSFRWFRSRDRIFLKEDDVVKEVIGIAEDITLEKLSLEQNHPTNGPVGLS